MRPNWVSKMIHWELCKRLKGDHADKWYMQKLESVQENKILWDFEIQIDLQIPVRRLDLVLINKKKISFHLIPADHRVKIKESKKIDKYLDLGREFYESWIIMQNDGYLSSTISIILHYASSNAGTVLSYSLLSYLPTGH